MQSLVTGDFSYLNLHANEVNREEFWTEVILQLNKDLGSEKAIGLSQPHIQAEDVAEAIVKALQDYLQLATPRLSEILYRIDIGEDFEVRLKNLPVDLYYRILAEMVLKREIQKVLTRTILRNNNHL